MNCRTFFQNPRKRDKSQHHSMPPPREGCDRQHLRLLCGSKHMKVVTALDRPDLMVAVSTTVREGRASPCRFAESVRELWWYSWDRKYL